MDCAFVPFQPQCIGADPARPMIQNDGGQQAWTYESAWLQNQQHQVQQHNIGANAPGQAHIGMAPPVEPSQVPVIFVHQAPSAYEPTVEAPMNPMYSSVTPQQYEDLHQLKCQYQQQHHHQQQQQQEEGSWQFIASKRQRMEPLAQPTWLLPGAQGITAGGSPSSRFHGVTWYKASRRWQARLCTGRKQIHLGYYKVEQDAARAYDLACLQHPGTRLSQLNFPEEAAAILKGTAGPPDASRLVLMARVHEAFKAAGASTPGRMLGNGLHAAIAQLEQQMILNPFRLGSDAALHSMSEGDAQPGVIKTHTSGEQLSNISQQQQQQQQSSPSSGNSEWQAVSPRVLLHAAEAGQPLQSPPPKGRADTVGQADSLAQPACAAVEVQPTPAAVQVLPAPAATLAVPPQQLAVQPPLAPTATPGSTSSGEPQAVQAAPVLLPAPVQVPTPMQGQPVPLTATHELLRQTGQPMAPEMLTPQISGMVVPISTTGVLQVYEHVWDGTKLVLKSVVVGVMSSPLPSV